MTTKQIKSELKETLINLYNCTNDAAMKGKIKNMLNILNEN